MLLVTLDTNVLDEAEVASLHAGSEIPCQFAAVTVSIRERGDSSGLSIASVPETLVWGESSWGEAAWGGPIPEALVLGESPLGAGVLSGVREASVFESALRIISNGSFPPPGRREDLAPGERRQLRDAVVFEAHVREGRHVLVAGDARGFVNGGRRDALERLGRTRILTPSEFRELSAAGRLVDLLPS